MSTSEDEEVDLEIVSLSFQDNDGIIGFDAGRAISATTLWGRIVTYLRSNGPQNLFALASEARDIDYARGKLSIKVKKNSYDSIMGYYERLDEILKSFEKDLKLIILKYEDTSEEEYFQEVERIKKLLGRVPLRMK